MTFTRVSEDLGQCTATNECQRTNLSDRDDVLRVGRCRERHESDRVLVRRDEGRHVLWVGDGRILRALGRRPLDTLAVAGGPVRGVARECEGEEIGRIAVDGVVHGRDLVVGQLLLG